MIFKILSRLMPGVCSQGSEGGKSVRVGAAERKNEREKHIKEQIVNISRFIWPIVK